MKRLGRCRFRFGIVVAVGLAIALMVFTFWYCGSNGGRFVRATIALQEGQQVALPGSVKEITDPDQIRRLASFFPGLGRRRSMFSVGCETEAIVSFVEADGGIVEVHVGGRFEWWAWSTAEKRSESSLRVRGDVARFLEDLFPFPYRQATVVRVGPPRQVKQITDTKDIRRLASFFPGFDRGRMGPRAGAWERAVDVSFAKADGGVIEVLVNPAFEKWTQGRGDCSVEGDFATFLEDIFPKAAPE